MGRRQVLAIAGAAACAAFWIAAPASASTGWHFQHVPKPPVSIASTLYSVSCPAAGTCIAVGFNDLGRGNDQPLAERWDGNSWTVQPIYYPGVPAELTSVSCPSATDCIAVGASDGAIAVAEHWDGTSWTVQNIPSPYEAELNAVSCASPTSCTAVGRYFKRHDPRSYGQPLAEHWDGTRWAVQRVPAPPHSFAMELDGVSCPSATRCTAVGTYTDPRPASDRPLVVHREGKTWTVQAVPLPAGATYAWLNGVSCTRHGGCTAVGTSNASGGAPLAERSDGTTWTVQAQAAPAGTGLRAVSCSSAHSCTAVGFASAAGLAEHWDGTTWTVQATPAPPRAQISAVLLGLACRSAAHCTAVGYYTTFYGRLLGEHE